MHEYPARDSLGIRAAAISKIGFLSSAGRLFQVAILGILWEMSNEVTERYKRMQDKTWRKSRFERESVIIESQEERIQQT